MVHHSFDDLPDWLKEADAAIIPASFWDEDSDDPPKLNGYLALVPNSLDEPYQRVPSVPCAHMSCCISRLIKELSALLYDTYYALLRLLLGETLHL